MSDRLDIPPLKSSAQAEVVEASTQREELVVVCGECPERPYLQLTVPATIAVVDKITIEVTSHDQGFASDPNTASWSFFDLNVLDPSGHDRRRWRILDNRVGDGEPYTQHSTYPNEGFADRSKVADKWTIHSIRPHDTIQIIAMARFPGWQNVVHRARLSIVGQTHESLDSISPITRRAETFPTLTQAPSFQGLRRAFTQPHVQELYQPLQQNQREIRLLCIAPGTRDSPVNCTLINTTLSTNDYTRYEALSYCWGDLKASEKIYISEEPVRVLINLYDALRRLRKLDSSRIMWIDALCINQFDLDERAWQVQEMKHIYQCATQVVVWLGEQEKCLWETHRLEIRGILDREKDTPDVDLLPCDTMQLLDEQELKRHLPESALCTLLENPYFSRIWILQEVYHARMIRVMCGDQTFSWMTILQSNAAARDLRDINSGYAKGLPMLFSHMFPLTRAREGSSRSLGYYRHAPQRDILDIILAGLDFDATDPRDKLFALLPFTEFQSEPALQPDYNKDVAAVFRDFTRWWISSRKSLLILSATCTSIGRTWQRFHEGLPTLFEENRSSWSIWFDGKSAFANSSVGLRRKDGGSASGQTIVDIELLHNDSDPSVLSLRGVLIDRITAVGKFPYFAAASSSTPALAALGTMYAAIFDVYNTAKTYLVGSHAMVMQTSDMRETPPFDRGKIGDHIYAHEQVTRASGGTIECHGNSAFRTERGLQGLCPHQTQAGDVVVVLHGGNVPYLLRKEPVNIETAAGDKPDRYSFVGECFLPEYMHGQAMTDVTLSTQVFHLV